MKRIILGTVLGGLVLCVWSFIAQDEAIAKGTEVNQRKEAVMGRFAIVAYTPKSGKEHQLLVAVRKHVQVLRAEQLVTDKPAYVMRAGNGTIVEVFEWRSTEAIKQAHGNPAVNALWAEFGAACDFTPLTKLAETHQMFAEFDAIQLGGD